MPFFVNLPVPLICPESKQVSPNSFLIFKKHIKVKMNQASQRFIREREGNLHHFSNNLLFTQSDIKKYLTFDCSKGVVL